jgi:hypothetical protein
MATPVLVCGSMAFDTIAVFEGRFKEHILADRIQSLSVSFLVPSMRKEFGGCSGNIAYNMNLLGGKPVPVATVGEDAGEYMQRLSDLGVDVSRVKVIPDTFTAQCFITTDLDDNQITAFHPGAMSFAAQNDLSDADATWAIVDGGGARWRLQRRRGNADEIAPARVADGAVQRLADGFQDRAQRRHGVGNVGAIRVQQLQRQCDQAHEAGVAPQLAHQAAALDAVLVQEFGRRPAHVRGAGVTRAGVAQHRLVRAGIPVIVLIVFVVALEVPHVVVRVVVSVVVPVVVRVVVRVIAQIFARIVVQVVALAG